MKLYEIKGVEIFSEGTWNGEKYTNEDLKEMIRAHDDTSPGLRPFMKLGHDRDQKLLQTDGLPAAGWIGKLYIQGQKLMADFVDIPDKIYQLLKNRAYKKVSSEIYWDIEINGKTYKRFLSAVSLLGSDMPAVSTLDDILNLYGLKLDQNLVHTYSEKDKRKTYDFVDQGAQMPEPKEKTYTQKEMDAKISEFKSAENDALVAKEAKDKSDKEIADLKEYKTKAEADKIKLTLEKEKAENDKFLSDSEVPKSAQEYALALLGEDKKEYAFNDKKISKRDVLKKYTDILRATDGVNFDEKTVEGESENQKSEKALDEKIKKYSLDNKISYKEAYVALKGE